jgi:MYXO-CTERM domain-containing protein
MRREIALHASPKARSVPRMRAKIVVLASAALLIARPVLAADYGAKGSESFTESALSTQATGASGGTLVVPNGAGPYPIIVASHGFSASANNQIGWARHLASWGFVVAVPTFPGSTHATNGNIIVKTAAHARTTVGAKAAPGTGLLGHSAGGLATVLAAESAKANAVVLFDPVDKDDAGKNALAQVCAPTLTMFAAPGGCNNQGVWKPFADSAKGPATFFDIVGGSHCDGELPDRGVACALFCGGGADAARQTTLARYATTMFMAKLKGAADAAQDLTKAKLDANTALAGVQVRDTTTCAGNPGADAGAADSGGTSSSGSASSSSGGRNPGTPTTVPVASPSEGASSSSGGEVSPTNSDAASDSSGGCSTSPMQAGSTGLGLLAGMALLVAVARRRPQ